MKRSGQGLPGPERLGSTEINRIFESGSSGKSHYFIVRCLPNGLGFSRIAPVAGKKAGKAHVRNRLKRRIRQIYRTHKPLFQNGFDYVFIARPGVDAASEEDLLAAMSKAAERARSAGEAVAMTEAGKKAEE